jgi:hypothetical protein
MDTGRRVETAMFIPAMTFPERALTALVTDGAIA